MSLEFLASMYYVGTEIEEEGSDGVRLRAVEGHKEKGFRFRFSRSCVDCMPVEACDVEAKGCIELLRSDFAGVMDYPREVS